MNIIYGVTILIVSFASYETLIGAVDSNNSDIKEVQDDLKKRKHVFQILQSVIVLIELICVWFALMFRKNDGDILNDGYEEFEQSKALSNDLTLGSQGTSPFHDDDEKVMTASQKKRQSMREKYGLEKK